MKRILSQTQTPVLWTAHNILYSDLLLLLCLYFSNFSKYLSGYIVSKIIWRTSFITTPQDHFFLHINLLWAADSKWRLRIHTNSTENQKAEKHCSERAPFVPYTGSCKRKGIISWNKRSVWWELKPHDRETKTNVVSPPHWGY